ncbi:RNA 2',3'-cyclic phosphodiesterase [Lysobacter niastensis]|uniref:RNA 2',3'-cyclic phosphodiesterase n=1 Tax=Lysobacter niastensis TaxID=380629 RepID=A0ABS0BAI4_9GAMM|nr:RNA 2',3'-cyclic phosphodiesterase [Lysobacter niastensis]MBF6024657.1 RNA 2',3'-cyclic phosphodiesterase [Lysobacter niastensis]
MKPVGHRGDAAQDGMHRLFFALWPDDTLRAGIDEVARELMQRHDPGGRLLSAARYHMTLQFLGDFNPLPPSLIGDACAAADTLQLPPFDMTLDCAGSFHGSHVWWLGTQHRPPELLRLWDEMGIALARAKVPVKPHGQAFAPHLTILRNVRRFIAPEPVAPLPWRVDAFVLVDSRPGRDYEVVRRWPLLA